MFVLQHVLLNLSIVRWLSRVGSWARICLGSGELAQVAHTAVEALIARPFQITLEDREHVSRWGGQQSLALEGTRARSVRREKTGWYLLLPAITLDT